MPNISRTCYIKIQKVQSSRLFQVHDRDHLIAEFDDPNSSLQILVTTAAVGGSSYSL